MEDDDCRRVLAIRPGITGLPQVMAGYAQGAEAVELDLRYVRERSLALDLRLLGRTIVMLVQP